MITFTITQQEYENDVDEETRQFILDQNVETRKLINQDVRNKWIDRFDKFID